jgi:hypothetical protein
MSSSRDSSAAALTLSSGLTWATTADRRSRSPVTVAATSSFLARVWMALIFSSGVTGLAT